VQVELTPKQRMQKKKDDEIRKREEELKSAAGEAKANYN